MRPFDGIRILDFTRIVSGPYATEMFALNGAEVIKIEEPDGDGSRWGFSDPELAPEGLSSMFLSVNAGKKSITLNLKNPDAVDAVKRMVRDAHVVVENFRPGVMERLGIGYETMKAENPAVIYCAVSGYGQTGPEAKSPAYDGAMQGISGMMSVTGHPESGPVRAGYVGADSATGLQAAFAIAAALYRWRETGKGQYIDVSMLNSAFSFMAPTVSQVLNFNTVPGLVGNLGIGRQPTADLFHTKDGDLLFSVVTDKQVAALMRAIGLPRYVDDERFTSREARQANFEFIAREMQAALMAKTAAEWAPILNGVGAPCGRILALDEALDQPQVHHNNPVMEFTDPKTGRVVRALRPGYTTDADYPSTDQMPPRLGEHNAEVLGAMGYSAEEIKALSGSGT